MTVAAPLVSVQYLRVHTEVILIRAYMQDLDKWQQTKRVTTYPSLLAFLGYAFYFPGILVGPYLDFASYTALVDGSVYTSIERREEAQHAMEASRPLPKAPQFDAKQVVNAPREHVQKLEEHVDLISRRAVPSGRKRVAYRKLITGLAFLGIYVVYHGSFNYHVGVEEWFASKGFLYRSAAVGQYKLR
jgi:lysophospholipid acyltransferase